MNNDIESVKINVTYEQTVSKCRNCVCYKELQEFHATIPECSLLSKLNNYDLEVAIINNENAIKDNCPFRENDVVILNYDN